MSKNKKRIKSTTCPNCHEEFADVKHNFCPFCGQENHTHKLPVKHFVMETLESLTHFDTKFLNTLKDLVLKPGLVIKNYNTNKRARYVPPIRMYVFTSFILFLLVTILFKNSWDKKDEFFDAAKEQPKTIQVQLVNKTEIDALTLIKLKSIKNLTNVKLDSVLKTQKIKTDWFNTKLITSIVKLQTGELKKSDVYQKIFKYLSYSFFIFMPFFALILKVFYFRRNYYYSEFLVFSIYYHIFIFGLLTILLLLESIFGFDVMYLIAPFLISIFIYLGITLKKVFEGSWRKTIFKTSILSFIYLFCLMILCVFLILGSML